MCSNKIVIMLLACIALVQSYDLPRRGAPLRSKDIRLRCCQNQWTKCCERYPWEENRELYEDEQGSTDDDVMLDDGSGIVMMNFTKPLTDKPYCRRFSTPFYGNYYGDKCVNSYFLWYDVRLTRNVIEEFHRCVRMKDPEFLDRLIKLEEELRPLGERCCRKHQIEGVIYGVWYTTRKLQADLAVAQRDFERQINGRRAPCANHGHWQSIEDRMAVLVWNMGFYIECAEELECPRLD